MIESVNLQKRLSGHAGSVYSLVRGPGKLILSGGADKMLASWSLSKIDPSPFSARIPATLYAIYYHEETHKLFLGTSSGNLHLVDVEQKKELRNLELHPNGCFDLVPCSKGLYVLGGDGRISLIDFEGELLEQMEISSKKVRRGWLTEDESLLYLATGEGEIVAISTEDHQIKHRFQAHEGSVFSLMYHPEKNVLVSGGHDAYIRFWDLADNHKMVHEIPAHNYAIYDLIDCGDFFASASRDRTVKIWDRNFELLHRLDREEHDGHLNSVNRLLWDQEEQVLVSAGDDRSLLLWEVA